MLTTQNPLRILMIGAGAIGQVYGHHLAKAGAEVCVLVRPQYREEARAGYSLRQHHITGISPKKHRFVPHQVFSSLSEAQGTWHQVWLCVPSNALHEPWVQELRQSVGDATVVLLTPGIRDLQILAEAYPPDRIISGMISMASYFAPLPGQNLEPCTAYFFPPLSPSLFEGESHRVSAVTNTLKRGGCPAAKSSNARAQAATVSAIMMPMIVALETQSWSISALRSDGLVLAIAAAKQAMNITSAELKTSKSPLQKILKPTLFKFALTIAPSVAPFPLETYLRVHFTKVQVQTDQMMKRYLSLAKEHDLPADQIERLYADWRQSLPQSTAETHPLE